MHYLPNREQANANKKKQTNAKIKSVIEKYQF